jgi:hypothetical protein
VSATVPSSKSLLKAINHMQHQVENITTLAIHRRGVRRMQEHFYKSTNFGQSQWLITDLSAQQGDGRSDSQKGDNTIIS